jgi:hypothetical protein
LMRHAMTVWVRSWVRCAGPSVVLGSADELFVDGEWPA